jgi:hypothetical protein
MWMILNSNLHMSKHLFLKVVMDPYFKQKSNAICKMDFSNI